MTTTRVRRATSASEAASVDVGVQQSRSASAGSIAVEPVADRLELRRAAAGQRPAEPVGGVAGEVLGGQRAGEAGRAEQHDVEVGHGRPMLADRRSREPRRTGRAVPCPGPDEGGNAHGDQAARRSGRGRRSPDSACRSRPGWPSPAAATGRGRRSRWARTGCRSTARSCSPTPTSPSPAPATTCSTPTSSAASTGSARTAGTPGVTYARGRRRHSPRTRPAPATPRPRQPPTVPQVDRAGSSDTGTNVQEAGVDEPDVVKTDGELLVRVQDDRLTTYDVTGASRELLETLDLPGLERRRDPARRRHRGRDRPGPGDHRRRTGRGRDRATTTPATRSPPAPGWSSSTSPTPPRPTLTDTASTTRRW